MSKLIYIVFLLVFIGSGCSKSIDIANQNLDIENATSSEYVIDFDDRLANVNFSETGNITDWDVATETYVDDWKLTYEYPGSAANVVNLILDDESVCVVANEEYTCVEILTKEFNGKRLYVQGVSDGDNVSVKRITF